MIEGLVITLIVIDVALIWLFVGKRKASSEPMDLLKDLYEEKRLTKDLHASFKADVSNLRQEFKDLHRKMVSLATEAECELNDSGKTLSQELDRLTATLGERVNSSVEDLAKQRTTLSQVIQKAQKQRQLLNKSIGRAETLIQFFQKRIPVEEVLEEIEDKKYVDARHLLSKGLSVDEVASEIGLSVSEVKLLATITT